MRKIKLTSSEATNLVVFQGRLGILFLESQGVPPPAKRFDCHNV
jgi:hypothetical protein